MAVEAILLFFASHIEAIRKIYMETKFETYDGGISYTGMTFNVKKTEIMTHSDCIYAKQNLCQTIDILNMLNIISLRNHDGVCLAYMFTSRDFAGGILGLAWKGEATGKSGGICERFREYRENRIVVWKSLNVGCVSTLNYGKEVPAKVSQLIFAHEVGHNFGSPHDSGTGCTPYETSVAAHNQGNYIMYPGAVMGDKLHNSEFSKCSKDNITRVIHAVITNSQKFNCFEESGSVCGNGIVEADEECDCGFYGDCKDSCCVARNTPDHTDFCKLTTGAQCSPSQGPCCESTCTYTSAASAKSCRNDDCFKTAFCDGNHAHCPSALPERDGTYCNNYDFTCKNGITV